jgi:uncharacterized membrane protein
LYNLTLYTHIFFGAIGLILGTIVLILKKGDKTHKRLGKFFSISMIIATLLSFVLSFIHPNIFLFSLGIFTIHMILSGWRFLSLKSLNKGQKPITFDWILLIVMAIFSISLIYLGIINIVKANYFGIAPLVFGIISFLNVFNDYKIYNGNIKEKNYWLLLHIQRMTGAYIASFTAFLVNTIGRILAIFPQLDNYSFVVWLLPSIIITPLIVKWSRENKIKVQ